jgi:peptide-methionine (S)-S-oxide reductase
MGNRGRPRYPEDAMKTNLVPITEILGLMMIPLLAVAVSGAAESGGGAKPVGKTATATFAGGCFWCMESPFDKRDGVVSVTVGYTGGHTKNPTYEEVSAGGTGHAEAVQIAYDPAKISYDKLLWIFWRNVDPLAKDAQFCDHGSQYRSAIFYRGEEQKTLAEASKKALEDSNRFPSPIVTEIVPASEFYPAEEYHQHYYKKNPVRYRYYRYGCGRDRRLEQLWGKEAGGH